MEMTGKQLQKGSESQQVSLQMHVHHLGWMKYAAQTEYQHVLWFNIGQLVLHFLLKFSLNSPLYHIGINILAVEYL